MEYEGTIEVCAHRVTFRYWDFELELTDELKHVLEQEAEDRAKHSINEGYHSGELNCLYGDHEHDGESSEIGGWWEIKVSR